MRKRLAAQVACFHADAPLRQYISASSACIDTTSSYFIVIDFQFCTSEARFWTGFDGLDASMIMAIRYDFLQPKGSVHELSMGRLFKATDTNATS